MYTCMKVYRKGIRYDSQTEGRWHIGLEGLGLDVVHHPARIGGKEWDLAVTGAGFTETALVEVREEGYDFKEEFEREARKPEVQAIKNCVLLGLDGSPSRFQVHKFLDVRAKRWHTITLMGRSNRRDGPFGFFIDLENNKLRDVAERVRNGDRNPFFNGGFSKSMRNILRRAAKFDDWDQKQESEFIVPQHELEIPRY